MGYDFEWDARKAKENLRKHDVSFEEASTVFADPLAMLRVDPDHSIREHRFLLLGTSTGVACWWWRLVSGHRELV